MSTHLILHITVDQRRNERVVDLSLSLSHTPRNTYIHTLTLLSLSVSLSLPCAMSVSWVLLSLTHTHTHTHIHTHTLLSLRLGARLLLTGQARTRPEMAQTAVGCSEATVVRSLLQCGHSLQRDLRDRPRRHDLLGCASRI